MLEPDERNLEGECETGEQETSGGELQRAGDKELQAIKAIRYGRVPTTKLEPRSSYSVLISGPNEFAVQRLPAGCWKESEWYTVATVTGYSKALDYIEERTGER